MESAIQRRLDDDGTATVTVRGEIDYANCDDLARCMQEAVTEWSPAVLRVELRGATFIDSTGLGALIEGYKAANDAEAQFLVINPTRAFRRVLDVTGLSDFFGLAESSVSDTEATQATGA
ncbi:STAS domain-containing protein [Paractinoplanes rishiriensis]|uniref:Anti-sigma factor antagonist n=1 Tax=Paractinoplanes rishiriensis TaxID=1050105 RepID=A0A919MWW2_9ACTN|nr:STAS domain-containing protein [Actinoplanes rishiriensis]GIE98258.1 anti-sigma factor antagonist [Actinoplanes rishiriensis]